MHRIALLIIAVVGVAYAGGAGALDHLRADPVGAVRERVQHCLDELHTGAASVNSVAADGSGWQVSVNYRDPAQRDALVQRILHFGFSDLACEAMLA